MRFHVNASIPKPRRLIPAPYYTEGILAFWVSLTWVFRCVRIRERGRFGGAKSVATGIPPFPEGVFGNDLGMTDFRRHGERLDWKHLQVQG